MGTSHRMFGRRPYAPLPAEGTNPRSEEQPTLESHQQGVACGHWVWHYPALADLPMGGPMRFK